MNGILLDTSVIIAYEKGKLDLHAWLATQSHNATVIATITVSELLYGVERDDATSRAQARRTWMDSFINASTVLDFDEECARIHARIAVGLEARGERIGAHDMLIAATALRHNMAVATLNAAEFKRVPKLKVITP